MDIFFLQTQVLGSDSKGGRGSFRCCGNTSGGSAPVSVSPDSLDDTIQDNVKAADAGTIVALTFSILGIILAVCLLAYMQQKGVFSRAFWFLFEGWASWAIKRKNKKLQKEVERQESELSRIEKKLENENFVNKAPQDVVDREREKAEEARSALAVLSEQLASLQKLV